VAERCSSFSQKLKANKIEYDSLIIGNGEVGSALKKVLDARNDKRSCSIIDRKDEDFKEKLNDSKCKTLHICIPYSKTFVKDTLNYLRLFQPELCIIHSTVPVGTTSRINYSAFATKVAPLTHVVHSPVRGLHPNLDTGLLTFVKYVGTDSKEAFEKAKKEMDNMNVVWFEKSEDSELGKLLDTSYYGVCISWHREMERLCKYFDVNFENAVTAFNISYNEGYSKLKPNVVRPVLTSPGKKKIGGHCVTQNAKLLNAQQQSKFLDLIK